MHVLNIWKLPSDECVKQVIQHIVVQLPEPGGKTWLFLWRKAPKNWMKSHDQAWEPCLKIEGKLNCVRMISIRVSLVNLSCRRISHVLNTKSSYKPEPDMWLHHVLCGGRRTVCILAAEEAGEENMHAWGHHTHKHILHIAMETSIFLQRPESFSFFFAFCFPPRPPGLASERCQMRKFILKERFKNRTSYSEDDSYRYKTLMQNLNHANHFRL